MVREGKFDRVVWCVAIFGLSCDLLIAVTTVLPGAPLLPQWPQFVLFPFMFVTIGATVLALQGRRTHLMEIMNGLPRRLRYGNTAFAAAAFVVSIWSITQIRGQPERHGGHYFLNDHGSLIPVSHAGYQHGLIYQQRIFTLIPSLFFACAVLVLRPSLRHGDH
jgi:hypothetical protein